MRRITLDLCRSAIFNRDQHSAGIGAIVRAHGVDDFLHDLQIIKGRSTSIVIRDGLVLNTTQIFGFGPRLGPQGFAVTAQIDPRSQRKPDCELKQGTGYFTPT